MMTTFQANVSATPTGTPLVWASGDLDVASADDLLDAAFGALGDGSALVLDLGEVTFMDSTGLGALIKIRNHIADRSGELTLPSLSPAVLRVLVLVGMSDAFGVAVPEPMND